MFETIREETIRQDFIQNVNQSFEDDDHDQLSTFKRSSLYDAFELIDIINSQIDLKKELKLIVKQRVFANILE